MIFIKNKTLYPRHIGDIQSEFVSWTPQDSLPAGWEEVEETTPPKSTSTSRVVESFPIYEDGTWKQSWSIVPITNADRVRYRTADPGQLDFQSPEL